MSTPADFQSKFVMALRTQKMDTAMTCTLPCPYGHTGRIFQNIDQLIDHANAEHETYVKGQEPKQARCVIGEAASNFE